MAREANSAFTDGLHVLRALVILAIAPLIGWVMLSSWIVPGVTLFLRGVPVDARVVRSELVPYEDSKGKPRVRAAVDVVYRWDGTERTSPAWREGEAPTAKTARSLERSLQALGVGATVRVWVDPEAPDRASLERSFSAIHAGMLGLVPLAVLFAFEHLARALASRRRALALLPGAPAVNPGPVQDARHLGPNFGYTSVLAVLVASAAGGGLAQVHPFAALAPVTACTALLLIAAGRVVAAWRTNARWKGVRLVPVGDGTSRSDGVAEAEVVGLGGRAAARFTPRLVLQREERDHPPDDDPDWVIDETLGVVTVEVDATTPGALRLRAPREPFGPLEPVPTFAAWARDRPLIFDDRERRVRQLLVTGEGATQVAFAWPPAALERPDRGSGRRRSARL